ncbi:MAG: hypothetical protein AAB971_02295 [Patescibacteria group bacterium]
MANKQQGIIGRRHAIYEGSMDPRGASADPGLQKEIDNDHIRALAIGKLKVHYPHTGETRVATDFFAPSRANGDNGGWIDQEQAQAEEIIASMGQISSILVRLGSTAMEAPIESTAGRELAAAA